MSLTPAARVAAIIASQSATVFAIGFSQSTCGRGSPPRLARFHRTMHHCIRDGEVHGVDARIAHHALEFVVTTPCARPHKSSPAPTTFPCRTRPARRVRSCPRRARTTAARRLGRCCRAQPRHSESFASQARSRSSSPASSRLRRRAYETATSGPVAAWDARSARFLRRTNLMPAGTGGTADARVRLAGGNVHDCGGNRACAYARLRPRRPPSSGDIFGLVHRPMATRFVASILAGVLSPTS